MPKLKQPILMKMMAFDILLEYLVRCCDQHSVNESLENLRHCVDFIKSNVCICILPCESLADFVNEFLDKFYNETRPATHNRAVIKILMDLQIVEIRCTSQILAALELSDACRFRGLKDLTLDCSSASVQPINLKTFYLKDLTILDLTRNCVTDNDLETIGRDCRKLKQLSLIESKEVTDKGLRALNQCSELQHFYIAGCRQISLGAIHELLFVHKDMQSLCASADIINGVCFEGPSLLQLDTSVYPSMNRLDIELDLISCDNLRSICLKFPNLTALGICGHLVGDLSLLKSLRKLTELNLTRACNLEWDNLNKLLKFTGTNITVLEVDIDLKQSDLNSIFKYCGNMGYLRFMYWSDVSQRKLIIPPFRKLKVLMCYGYRDRNRRSTKLEFGQMLDLELLVIEGFHLSTKTMKSIIFDNAKFPNLRGIYSPDVSEHCDINQLRQMAKKRNLDVKINQATEEV